MNGDGQPGGRHVHRFAFTNTIEGCHWWRVIAHCPCGARMEQVNERDPATDADAWPMLEPTCDRCCALAAGARPEHRRSVEMPS